MSEHNSELWIMAHETRLHQYEFIWVKWNTLIDWALLNEILYQGASMQFVLGKREEI